MEFKTKQCKLCNSEFKSRAGLSHHRRSERTFCKNCICTIENPKKLRKFSENDKTTFRQAKFASSDAKFCRDMRNNGCYTQNFVHNTRNFSLDMVLSP